MLPRLRRDEEEQERFPDEASETMELAAYDEEQDQDQSGDDEPASDPRGRPPKHRMHAD
jgi:hypothetical protein